MRNILFATVATFALPLLAMAQTMSSSPMSSSSMSSSPMSSPMSSTKMLSTQDRMFIKMASISGLAEVHDGTLAETMGSASVKAVGTHMVTDHSKANAELTSIAMTDGVTAPTMVDPMHAEINTKLKTLSGAAFDKEYLQTEMVGHEKTIALFETEASSGMAPNLKSFAATTLPILKEHLSMIKMAMT